MFGLYRTLLACVVVYHHLAKIPVAGQYAVHGFFVLSGYLMTSVMHRNYGYGVGGRLSFAANRALRLYPSYFATLLLSVGTIALIGEAATQTFRSSFYLPANATQWLMNATMVYWDIYPQTVMPRLSPATWALTLELFYYLLIALGVSRNKGVTVAWFLLGLAFHAYGVLTGQGEDFRYFHLLSGSLPFSVGALIYHYRDRLPKVAMRADLASAVAVVLMLGLSALAALKIVPTVTFYLNVVLSGVAVWVMINCTGNRVMDAKIGNFSYHIYILQWAAGVLVFDFVLHRPAPTLSLAGLVGATLAIVVSVVISLAMTKVIDEPIERLRRRLRKSEAPRDLMLKS